MTEVEKNALLVRLATAIERLEKSVIDTGQKVRMDLQVLHQRRYVLGERVTTLERRVSAIEVSAIEGDSSPPPEPSSPISNAPKQRITRAINELLDVARELDEGETDAG